MLSHSKPVAPKGLWVMEEDLCPRDRAANSVYLGNRVASQKQVSEPKTQEKGEKRGEKERKEKRGEMECEEKNVEEVGIE